MSAEWLMKQPIPNLLSFYGQLVEMDEEAKNR